MDVLNLTPAQKKQIIENAPATATKYGDNLGDPLYYKFENNYWWFFSKSLNDWATSSINYGDEDILATLIDLDDLRA